MNSPRQATAQRVAALSLAVLMTLGMLDTIDRLATSEPSAAELARVEAMNAART